MESGRAHTYPPAWLQDGAARSSVGVETMGHVGILIFMVYTAVEKVMVAEIGGPVLAETSKALKILLHGGR